MKPCLQLGCPRLAPKGSSYCSDHDPGAWHHATSFEERFGMSRSKWQRLAKRVRRRDLETCQRCGDVGRDVDHIVPRSQGGGNEMSNLQTLCKVCHTEKTREDRRGGRRG